MHSSGLKRAVPDSYCCSHHHTMAQQDLPIEHESLVRIVRGFLAADDGTSSENLPPVETAGSLLWDLTVDPQAVRALLQSGLVDAVFSQLDACSGQPASEVLSDGAPSAGRVLELCFGILANLYAFPEAVQQLVADKEVLLSILHTFTTVDDPPALSELCRMLAGAISTTEGCAAWTPLLVCEQQLLPHLMLVIQSTLHPQLLQRSQELVAALLHASRSAPDAATTQSDSPADDPAANPSSQLPQQLWDAGLADTLLAVLMPAAACPATAAATKLQPGSWDDDASDTAGNNSSIHHIEQRLYRQPEVLEALVGVLEQLAMQPDGVDTAIQHIPKLPQLMLQLLAGCSTRGDQNILELLLPVLVIYRTAVLPLLQQQEQLQSAGHQGLPAAQSTEGSQQQQGLQYVVHIAAVLQDCSDPDSLDALDAGWYLCAAATRGLLLHGQPQAEGFRAAAGSAQQVQQPAEQASASPAEWNASMVTRCQLLEEICRSLSLASIPETAVAYALQFVRNASAAVATSVDSHAAPTQGSTDSAVQPIRQSLQQTLDYLSGILRTLQDVLSQRIQCQQEEDANEGMQQHMTATTQQQQHVAELQQAIKDL